MLVLFVCLFPPWKSELVFWGVLTGKFRCRRHYLREGYQREGLRCLPRVVWRKASSLIRKQDASWKRMEALHWQSSLTGQLARKTGNWGPGDHFKGMGPHGCEYRWNLERSYSANYKNWMSQQMVAFPGTCLKEGIAFKASRFIPFPLRHFFSTGKDMPHKLISWMLFWAEYRYNCEMFLLELWVNLGSEEKYGMKCKMKRERPWKKSHLA